MCQDRQVSRSKNANVSESHYFSVVDEHERSQRSCISVRYALGQVANAAAQRRVALRRTFILAARWACLPLALPAPPA